MRTILIWALSLVAATYLLRAFIRAVLMADAARELECEECGHVFSEDELEAREMPCGCWSGDVCPRCGSHSWHDMED
ncbi:hypothetical protein ACI09J_001800 [Cronobacter turicensis]